MSKKAWARHALEWAAESAEREEREIWGGWSRAIEVLYDGSLVFHDQTTHYEDQTTRYERSFHFGG